MRVRRSYTTLTRYAVRKTSSFRKTSIVVLVAMIVGIASSAHAEDMSLMQVLALARQNDPQYLTALARLRAAQERSSQATSYMLPQLAVKGGANRNDRSYETLGSVFPVPVSKTKYNGYNACGVIRT